ncbi:MAG TPA: P-loop NTPase [Candidatus Gracilibacteria bacterium]|nr:P-loop NTPase [Candidatus Gracilibacteria bacterium]
MLTGQESIVELLRKSKRVAEVLIEFGITAEVADHLRLKNLAHAAIVLKQPLRKILTAVADVTGEEVKEPDVKGMDIQRTEGVLRAHGGLQKGFPEGVRRVILVHSGKGGVGKTFVTVNLAAALAQNGKRVGILDADIDCPNVMKMLRLEGKLTANARKKIQPLEKFGVKVVSMAPTLHAEDQVTLWRGPITSRALEQFLYDTDWGELDFLIVDLPPGTSDIPISALNMLEGAEMIVVTTPQELAIMDARKSVQLAKKMKANVIAIVENMASGIFGESGTEHLAESLTIRFGGTIPLRREYANIAEDGGPAVLKDAELADTLVKTVL